MGRLERVIVLGASGYLGYAVCTRLRDAGHEVTGLSRSVESDARLAAIGATPLRGDLNQLESFLPHLRDFEAVVYAAQLMLEPERDCTRAILETLRGSDTAFIFTSGTGVLSEKTNGDWSENSFSEDDPFVPSRFIGARVQTEELVRAIGRDGEVRAMVIRPPLIWGQGGCSMIQSFYDSASLTGTVCHVGAGLNLYSNVHVEDLASLFQLAVTRGSAGALYHAVAGEIPNRFVARGVAEVLDLPVRSVSVEEAIGLWGKSVTLIAMSTCSRSRAPRAREELGWAPRYLDMMADVAHPAYRQKAEALAGLRKLSYSN